MSDDRAQQNEINNEIMRALGRLEGQMSGTREDIQEALAELKDHDGRIGRTEQELSGIKIKIGVIEAVIGAFFSAVGDWIWRKFVGH
jgi:peptidoglycan hydrolase CwlO-like protein